MLQIRPSQKEVFRQVALGRFAAEMVAHAQEFSPKLCGVLGEEQVRAVVQRALDGGDRYKFTNRGPLRLYVELTFLYGGSFDTDPQYPWAAKILRRSGDQMARAQELYEQVLAYQQAVSGPGGMHTRRALTSLQVFLRHDPVFTADGYAMEIRRGLQRVFPEKMIYLGDDAVTGLIHESNVEARRWRLPPGTGEALLAVLKFSFGHGCTDDLLYPWIARTLQDERIADPAARTERLQRKAVTWLDHVLSDSPDPIPT